MGSTYYVPSPLHSHASHKDELCCPSLSSFRWNVVSVGQAADLSLPYAPWSVNLPHQKGKQLTVPSLALYAYISCFMSHDYPYHLLWPTKKDVGIHLLT